MRAKAILSLISLSATGEATCRMSGSFGRGPWKIMIGYTKDLNIIRSAALFLAFLGAVLIFTAGMGRADEDTDIDYDEGNFLCHVSQDGMDRSVST